MQEIFTGFFLIFDYSFDYSPEFADVLVPKRGKNGKYYCGKRLDGPHCNCCNGYCGPTNGCNCRSCMKLDIKGLPTGYLINREGTTSSLSPETGRFYCGMKVLVGVQGCDGRCGPNNGPNCQDCQILQKQANTRYKGIANK